MSTPETLNRNFVAVSVCDAIYKTQQGDQSIILESRAKADRTETIFTIIGGQEVRAGSIQELVLKRSDCISLTIEHAISVVWNGVLKTAVLYEIFIHDKNNPAYPPVKIILSVDNTPYETSECDSFSEAMFDLHDVTRPIAEWRLVTCYDCKYSYPAFSGPHSASFHLLRSAQRSLRFRAI